MRPVPSVLAILLLLAGCDPKEAVFGSVEQLADECIVDVERSTVLCTDRQGGAATIPLRMAGDRALPAVLDLLGSSDPRVQVVAAMQLHNAHAAPDALDPAKVDAASAAEMRRLVAVLPPHAQRRAVSFTVSASARHDLAATRAFLDGVDDREGALRGWAAFLEHSPPEAALADLERVRAMTVDPPFPEARGKAYVDAARMKARSPALDEALCDWGMEGLETEDHNLASSVVEKRCPDGEALVIARFLKASASNRLTESHVRSTFGLCDAKMASLLDEPLPVGCNRVGPLLRKAVEDPSHPDGLRGQALRILAMEFPGEATGRLIESVAASLPEEAASARGFHERRMATP
jgi:hypothetical protein